jgi:nitrate/nitrite transporter NarK
VFGAFVALALWLPQYLIGVYGVDIKVAGMLAAAFSIPASLFRAYGGILSDSYGARRIVMYWTFGVSMLHLHAVLSADRLRRSRRERPDQLSTRWACGPSSW